jgi:nicotinamide riboside kinase
MRKIAFVGTSCIGKTTIFKYYQSKLAKHPDFSFVNESAREYLEKHPTKFYKLPINVTWEIGRLTIEKEKVAHASGAKIIVCDRSVLDPVAYLTEQHNKKEADKLLQHNYDWLSTYTDFFLFNPDDVPYKNDDIRKDRIDERQRVHSYFLELFSELQIPYKLISGTLDERIRKIDVMLAENPRDFV